MKKLISVPVTHWWVSRPVGPPLNTNILHTLQEVLSRVPRNGDAGGVHPAEVAQLREQIRHLQDDIGVLKNQLAQKDAALAVLNKNHLDKVRCGWRWRCLG